VVNLATEVPTDNLQVKTAIWDRCTCSHHKHRRKKCNRRGPWGTELCSGDERWANGEGRPVSNPDNPEPNNQRWWAQRGICARANLSGGGQDTAWEIPPTRWNVTASNYWTNRKRDRSASVWKHSST